jgi:hypothetical protein
VEEEEEEKKTDMEFPSNTFQQLPDGETDVSRGQIVTRSSKDLEGPVGYNCDGRCGTSWSYADDIYVCRECKDVQFDKGCFDSLKAGTLER